LGTKNALIGGTWILVVALGVIADSPNARIAIAAIAVAITVCLATIFTMQFLYPKEKDSE
jgi:MFS-type transporter involved in bile tolerance (Atg22 family)